MGFVIVKKSGQLTGYIFFAGKEECSEEDEECNAGIYKARKENWCKNCSSGQDDLKQERLFQALLITVAIKLLLCQLQEAILQFH